jgi:cell division inhibitor SulA/protein ImuA
MSADELARLLEHPAIWRGTSAAQMEVLPTGFDALDQRLPGRGWPRSGLIEILISRFGIGELSLLLPVLSALTRKPLARWCVWVAPPLEPFAPALSAHGVALDRVLVVRGAVPKRPSRGRTIRGGPRSEPMYGSARSDTRRESSRGSLNTSLWAFEQSLGSGACDLVMAWIPQPRVREIRRLQLAAERGRALGVLFRPWQAARESSHAVLRMTLGPTAHGLRATLLKSRGGVRGSVELVLQAARS